MRRNKAVTALVLTFVMIFTSLFSQANISFAKNKAPDKRTKTERRIEKTQILVKYKDTANEAEVQSQTMSALGISRLEDKGTYRRSDVEMLEIDEDEDINKVVNKLRQNPDVEFAQPNYKLSALGTANDSRFMEQWNLSANEGSTPIDINAPQGWDITKGSPTVLVGVLDTGIDIGHNDLSDSIYTNANEIAGNGIDDDGNGYIDDVNGWDFYNGDNTVFDNATEDTHGTHIAGIIAAAQNNTGISGVAPKVKVLPLKFISNGQGYTSDVLAAIEYAQLMGVKIINCSFGGADNNPALKEAMENSGILFVCAAGNDGKDLSTKPVYPASFNIPNAIAVAATDNSGNRAAFSNYGEGVDVAAPGKDILSTLPGNRYGYLSGTSMAAPHAAATAALVKSHIPDIQTPELIARLKQGVRVSNTLSGKVSTGGIIDASAALLTAITEKPPEEKKPDEKKDDGKSQTDGLFTTLAATVSPQLLEQIHYGEVGVNVATGNFSDSVTDMTLEAPGFKVNISRTYNSKDDRATSTLGRGWTFGFEGSFKQDTANTAHWVAKLPNGSAQVFVKSGETYTANDSRSTLVKQPDGTHILTTKDQYTYGFNTSGYLAWMKDKNGNAVNITVDASGKVTKITDQVGRSFTVEYDASNKITKITDPMGRTVQYGYKNNLLETVTDPMNFKTTYTYDTSNYLTSIKDKNNTVTDTLEYDHTSAAHKVKIYKDIRNVTETFAYDTANKKTTITYNGRTIVKWYDDQFYVIKSQDPEGKLASITYYLDTAGTNKHGEEKAITDRNGNTTEYVRDTATGNITKIINPDKTEKSFVYDAKNNLIKETDETGRIVQYFYDEQKINLLKEVRPLDGKTEYTETADQSKFAITSYAYYTSAELSYMGVNANNLLKSVTDPEGNVTRHVYDAYGNIVTTVDPMGYATLKEFNILGWVTSVTTAQGYKTQFGYDLNGNLVKQIGHNSETTRIVYDNMGRKLQEIEPNQYDWTKDSSTGYSETTAGTRYEYYTDGNVKKVTDAAGNITEFTYDEYGSLKTKTLSDLSQYIYEYDVMNRQTKEYFKEDNTPASVQTLLSETSYAINADKTTSITKTQYLNSTEKAVSTATFDALNRPISQLNPDGTTEKTEYYPNGLVKGVTDENNSTAIMNYDGLNRLSEKWMPAEKVRVENGIYIPTLYMYTEYVYDRAGRVIAEKAGKDLVEIYQKPVEDRKTVKGYEYFANGKVKAATNSANGRIEYFYDKDGNVTREKTYTSQTEFIQKDFKYNHMGKLTEEKLLVDSGDIYPNKIGSTVPNYLATKYGYDNNGNMIYKTTPDMHTVSFEYDILDRQIKSRETGVDEAGMPVMLEVVSTYDNMGRLKTVTDVDGDITTYHYDKRGNLVKTELTYKENGTAKTEVRTASAYDLGGRLITEVSAQGYIEGKLLDEMNRVEHVYDLMSRKILSRHVYKELPTDTEWKTQVSAAIKYDNTGNVIKSLDGEGYAAGVGSTIQDRINSGYGVTRTYNLAGQLSTELDPVSKDRGYVYTVKYSYDGLGRKKSEAFVTGGIANYYYDDASRLIETTVQQSAADSEKTVQKNVYDRAGLVSAAIDSLGNTTTFKYNKLGKASETIYPGDESVATGKAVFQYDEMGRAVFQRDPSGTEIISIYDILGRQIAQTRQGEGAQHPITVRTSYDIKGNPVLKTDGEGNISRYSYNYLDKVDTETLPTGKTVKYAYDKAGNLLTKTDWLNNTYTSRYDALSRLVEKLDPNNAVIEKLQYDLSNKQTVSIDGKGNQKTFTYDKNGRLVLTTDQEGFMAKKAYDARGNVKSETDGNGNTTFFEYDALNRLIKVINALGEVTGYTYDGNGNMLTQTDGNGSTIAMVYNARNLLMKKISPNSEETGSLAAFTETYFYNADGTMKEKKDRNGVTTSYVYDFHKRLINQIAGNDKILNTYDDNGNILSTVAGEEITTRTYDPVGRVATKYVSGIGTASYTYDIADAAMAAGELAEKSIDPKGNETTKIYDKLGRLKEVKTAAGSTTYAYDENGNQKQVTYPNGASEKYTYFKNNKLQLLENFRKITNVDTIMDSYTYTYDGAGNQLSKTERINGTDKGSTNYTYDKLNRLKEVYEPSMMKTLYQYDKAGNRTLELKSKGGLTDTTYYTYDKQNRLTQTLFKKNGEKTTTRYFYDNNGNMTSQQQEVVKNADKTTQPKFGIIVIEDEQQQAQQAQTLVGNAFYTYNAFNQMIKSASSGKTSSYAYNGEGYRTLKMINGKTSHYFYEYDNVILEVDENGKEQARNVYGLNLVSRKVTVNAAAEEMFFMYNGHADVTALLDTGGQLVGSYYYDAFGNIQEQTGTKDNPYRYAGYRFDDETGLYYLNARYYDSKIARFMSEDTYTGKPSDPLSLNLYTYCVNNPIRYFDPTGHAAANVTIGDVNVGNAQVNNGVTTGNLRDIVAGLGGSVAYDNTTKIATVVLNGKTITYDTNTMKDNYGNSFTCINGRIQVGVRDMTKVAGVESSLSYGNDSNGVHTVTVTGKTSNSDKASDVKTPETPKTPEPAQNKPTETPDTSNCDNSGGMYFAAGGEDIITQAAIRHAKLRLDEILSVFYRYAWPQGYAIEFYTYGTKYNKLYEQEVENALKIAGIFNALDFINTIRESYQSVAAITGKVNQLDSVSSSATISATVVLTLINTIWPQGGGLNDLPEFFGINSSINKNIAKALEKSEFINNSIYKYLVDSDMFDIPKNKFINEITNLHKKIQNESYQIYNTIEENNKYKSSLLKYLETIKNMNIYDSNPISELNSRLKDIDKKYK